MKTEHLVGLALIAYVVMGGIVGRSQPTPSSPVRPSIDPSYVLQKYPTWESLGAATYTMPVNPISPSSGQTIPVHYYSKPTSWGSELYMVI